jgi:hypothetical protein
MYKSQVDQQESWRTISNTTRLDPRPSHRPLDLCNMVSFLLVYKRKRRATIGGHGHQASTISQHTCNTQSTSLCSPHLFRGENGMGTQVEYQIQVAK